MFCRVFNFLLAKEKSVSIVIHHHHRSIAIARQTFPMVRFRKRTSKGSPFATTAITTTIIEVVIHTTTKHKGMSGKRPLDMIARIDRPILRHRILRRQTVKVAWNSIASDPTQDQIVVVVVIVIVAAIVGGVLGNNVSKGHSDSRRPGRDGNVGSERSGSIGFRGVFRMVGDDDGGDIVVFIDGAGMVAAFVRGSRIETSPIGEGQTAFCDGIGCHGGCEGCHVEAEGCDGGRILEKREDARLSLDAGGEDDVVWTFEAGADGDREGGIRGRRELRHSALFVFCIR
mmetsp:Transcript_20688/g.43818  ORF Transcript_20688/g.43818 Transcript_20688/m.43818 type:complete len:286 (-) Transcript_20688:146-1003(-)